MKDSVENSGDSGFGEQTFGGAEVGNWWNQGS